LNTPEPDPTPPDRLTGDPWPEDQLPEDPWPTEVRPEDPQPEEVRPTEVRAEDEAFYAATFQRIVRFMLVLAIPLFPLLWIKLHRAVALAFLAGSAIAFVNFYWLRRTVEALGERVVNTGMRQSSSGVVTRFLLRYALIAVAAYGIFRSSADSVYGLFAGLFLPVGAILIEAVYATYGALRRGL
jgi:hypothetical protein